MRNGHPPEQARAQKNMHAHVQQSAITVIEPNRHTAGTRGRDGRFLPGASGNPGGRVGSNEEFKRIRGLYRENSEEAVREVRRLMRESDDDRVRLAACQLVMERGWGKAPDSYIPEQEPDSNLAEILTHLTADERNELRALLEAQQRLINAAKAKAAAAAAAGPVS